MLYKRVIQLTEDGSHTIAVPGLNITYHSRHGAIQESAHVFIKAGLHYFLNLNLLQKNETLHIFEVGFGTGLNALLSLNEAINLNRKIFYETIEPYPLSDTEAMELNYASLINKKLKQDFLQLHQCNWSRQNVFHTLFSFQKINITLQNFETGKKFHLIYFDAFDANTQPELWTETIFDKIFHLLHNNGILVTYCSKGTVRRTLQSAGFSVKKLAGPPGKREILRATKI